MTFGLAQSAGGVTSGAGWLLGAGAHTGTTCLSMNSIHHLTRPPRRPIPVIVSRLDGRSGKGRKVAGEESPGSMDMRCRITSGGGNPRDSATENKPPRRAGFGVGRGKGEMVR